MHTLNKPGHIQNVKNISTWIRMLNAEEHKVTIIVTHRLLPISLLIMKNNLVETTSRVSTNANGFITLNFQIVVNQMESYGRKTLKIMMVPAGLHGTSMTLTKSTLETIGAMK